LLDKWYTFKETEQNKVLRKWCKDNAIIVDG
jgi:hypothetical protein